VDIRYFYKNKPQKIKAEAIIDSFANAIGEVIELPNTIEICLYDLGKNVYGGIDMYAVNRIGLNYDLDYESIPLILTHELIHVNQKHKKHLEVRRNGYYYWMGIPHSNKPLDQLTFEEYQNLPWEVDVIQRQTKVLQMAMEILAKKVL